MTSTPRTILTAAAVLGALAAPAAALADDGVAASHPANPDGKVVFTAKPFLVATSDGVYLEYSLNRNASKHAITIGGKKARFYVDKHAGPGHYRGFVEGPRFDAGKTFTVKIVVVRPGKDLVRVDRLFVRNRNPGLG
ncbi:MAG: hypothetical protein QOI64_775 [Solirubrobacteraceae bacterium]|jgi:hypothetical protein|nr:hypothetical protein [Solirubrobacteraceae bacterium]